jgi:hypothetical protein
MAIKRIFKRFLPHGRRPRTIRTGFYRGIRLNLDLQFEMQVFLGLYEQETFADMRRLARGCRGFLDLGAAKGELSIRFLREPDIERVVAAEPEPVELALFHANLMLNGLASDPRLMIHAGFAGKGQGPEWRTLDELANGVAHPLFIKMDIEGVEAAVLATGRGTLGSGDCRLLIETHSPEAEAGCLSQLAEMGYSTKIISPAWWRALVPEHRGNIAHNRWLVAWRPDRVA